MSMGSWLKAHRKSLITHTSIIVVFVLFTIFVSGPLFDRFEAMSVESRLHEFPLPAETGGITYCFGEFATDGRATVEIRGWAFIDGEDSVESEIYIVLKSADRTYIFDTMVRLRPDVTKAFEELKLNLNQSGFTALLPARKIADGEYTVGIYIRKGDMEALQYTNKAVTKSKGVVELTG